MVKQRLEVSAPSVAIQSFTGEAPSHAVVAEKDGNVSILDKAKAYYHSLFVLVGVLLVGANQILPLVPADVKGVVDGAIAVLTFAGVLLKSNEQWFDAL